MSDSTLINFLIEKSGGLIKDENQANILLVSIAVILFIVSGVILFNTFYTPSNPNINQGPPIVENLPPTNNPSTPSTNRR